MEKPPKRRARLNLPEVFPPVSEEHAAAIGYVAIQWSAVEWAIIHLVRNILGLPDPATFAIIGDRTAVAALNVASVLVRLSGDETTIAEWDALANRHETLRPIRNEAIHSEWRVVGDQHYAMRAKSNRKLTVSFRPIDTKTLGALADDCLALAEEITAFSGKLLERGVHHAILSSHPPGQNSPPPQPRTPKPSQASALRRPRLSSAQKPSAAANGGEGS